MTLRMSFVFIGADGVPCLTLLPAREVALDEARCFFSEVTEGIPKVQKVAETVSRGSEYTQRFRDRQKRRMTSVNA